VGIARAVALRDGRPISLDTARRMLAFFTRSARFEAAPKPSKSWQAWNLWGGSAARDALEHDPMICLPCMNPRAPVETAAAACMREIAHRSNPPKMPRTAKEARDALAAAYDDAVGRARVGAFRGDLSATRAALDDAARYSYALGFYGEAPAVPYYLLDRMRAPADARQPDLFARANPARDAFARQQRREREQAQRLARKITKEAAAPPPEPKRRPWATQPENRPPRSLEAQAADAREYIAMYEQQAAAARAAGNKTLEMMALDDVATYRADLAAVLADMEREEARQAAEDAALSSWEPEPPALAEINDRVDLLYQRAMLLARTADTVRGTISRRDARLQADKAVSDYEAASRERDKIAASLGVTLPDPLMGVSSPPAPAAPPSPLEVLGAQVEAAAVRAEAAAVAADAVKGKRPRRAARAAADAAADEYADALRARAALSERMGDEAIAAAQARARSKPAKPLDAAGVALLRQREAEAQAAEAEMVRQREGEERRAAAWREIEQIAASLPDTIPTGGPLASLSDLDLADQITAPNKRPSRAPEYTAKLKAETAARGVPFDWRGANALRERARRMQRMKPAKPSKPAKPAKPAAPRRPVTGKAREVLARLGALGPVSLADVARVGCTDDTGARRIVAALIRAEAAAPAGPGAWMLDPARLDECPPQRPRTREPRPVCVGECGRWTPPKDAPAWIAALGPTSTIYDSEGRPYPVRWALARLDTLGDGWHASNVNGRADPKYDRELQARERGSSASRAQVEKIAGSLSLAQWVAPSSTPADSAPVVWIDPSARGHVVSGNGRTAAYALARPSRLAVAETVGGRWKIPKTLRAALESADLVPVRIMGGPGEIDRAAAVLLAGASQASASGSLTQTERALSTVRALGLTVADMPALDWPEALTVARLVAFIGANRAWAAWATAPLAPERAILLSSDPLALTVHFRDVLIGLLPPEAREGGIGGLSIDRALVGALPGIWTLETRIRDGRAPSAWSLVAVLPEARGWARKSAGRLKEIAADAATDERQAGLFGPARLDTEGARLLAVALGGALARASGRTDPEAAGAEMVAALLAAAPDPSQPSLLGIDDTDPVEVLARKARLSLPRSNPPGRDLERLSDAAKRWHWGRYKRAKSARVDRATWQPSQGFALGELAAITLGADRLEVPPGHLLCATEEGGGADLFVVPPLPLGSLAPRPLRAIEYLADKAGDGPSWYVHDFDSAYPVAQTKRGALAIVRKGSRFSIDPERGIVG
jgi:hypothetical protein